MSPATSCVYFLWRREYLPLIPTRTLTMPNVRTDNIKNNPHHIPRWGQFRIHMAADSRRRFRRWRQPMQTMIG